MTSVESKAEWERRWSFRGCDKWKEFVDGNDHGQKAFGYDKDRTGMLYLDGFLLADDYARRSLGKPLTVTLYRRLQQLCMLRSPKPWRSSDSIEWSLAKKTGGAWPEATEKMRAAVEKHGLRVREDYDTADGVTRLMVITPPVHDEMYTMRSVGKVFNEYDAESGRAGGDVIAAIARAYQKLELLHAFQDGTSRTNHLIMNKLLVENGEYPVVLDSPSSPGYTEKEWTGVLKALVEKTRAGAGAFSPSTKREDLGTSANIVAMATVGILGGAPDWFRSDPPAQEDDPQVRQPPGDQPAPSGSVSSTTSVTVPQEQTVEPQGGTVDESDDESLL